MAEIKTAGNGGATLQDDVYGYDGLHNMNSRQDQHAGTVLREAFSFDSLNRLTGSTVGGLAVSYTPDDTGNIQSKTGVGTYTYGENRAGPHAVTSIVLESGLAQASGTNSVHYRYDANGNLVSGPAWSFTAGGARGLLGAAAGS